MDIFIKERMGRNVMIICEGLMLDSVVFQDGYLLVCKAYSCDDRKEVDDDLSYLDLATDCIESKVKLSIYESREKAEQALLNLAQSMVNCNKPESYRIFISTTSEDMPNKVSTDNIIYTDDFDMSNRLSSYVDFEKLDIDVNRLLTLHLNHTYLLDNYLKKDLEELMRFPVLPVRALDIMDTVSNSSLRKQADQLAIGLETSKTALQKNIDDLSKSSLLMFELLAFYLESRLSTSKTVKTKYNNFKNK